MNSRRTILKKVRKEGIKMKKKQIVVAFILVLVILLVSCAAGPNSFSGTENADGEIAGFLLGLWHGCISGIAFIISLFNDKVNVYEVYNNGGWYNFGFILGVMIVFGGSSGSAARKKRNK